jgi:hypothetical protein
MRPHTLLAVTCLFSLLSFGCAKEYKNIDFEKVTTPPYQDQVDITSDIIQLPEGVAVAVKTKLKSKKRAYDKDDKLELQSEDEAVFRVAKTLEARQFVMWGVSPGTTCMTVKVKGKEQACIDVQVRDKAP